MSRMLIMDRQSGQLDEGLSGELPRRLRGDELIVLNDTAVIPARLRGRKDTGGAVEFLVLEELSERPGTVLAMARGAKKLRAGMPISLSADTTLVVSECLDAGHVHLELPRGAALMDLLNTHGALPLPPYIERPSGPDASDAERYQTVFARAPGAVAAPTAGLHFTPSMLDSMRVNGHEVVTITLHVGPGTFTPVRVRKLAEHRMHLERYEVSAEAAEAVNRARREGRPVLAVGTTTVRTLEACAARHDGLVVAESASTDLFIRPGYPLRVVDQLLTNFHLPGSTLLMLVSAFVGRERLLSAYTEAVARGFRFYSYGDAMWVR